MNRHLLHPTLLHGLLQRMAGYRHLYAMRANRLDIVLVFPRHQRKNLRAQKQKGTQRIKDDDKAKKKTTQRLHVAVGHVLTECFTSPSSFPVGSGAEMVALLMALLMV